MKKRMYALVVYGIFLGAQCFAETDFGSLKYQYLGYWKAKDLYVGHLDGSWQWPCNPPSTIGWVLLDKNLKKIGDFQFRYSNYEQIAGGSQSDESYGCKNPLISRYTIASDLAEIDLPNTAKALSASKLTDLHPYLPKLESYAKLSGENHSEEEQNIMRAWLGLVDFKRSKECKGKATDKDRAGCFNLKGHLEIVINGEQTQAVGESKYFEELAVVANKK